MSKVIIIMGSKADLDWAKQITRVLDSFVIENITRIASAHKVPLKCYDPTCYRVYERQMVN